MPSTEQILRDTKTLFENTHWGQGSFRNSILYDYNIEEYVKTGKALYCLVGGLALCAGLTFRGIDDAYNANETEFFNTSSLLEIMPPELEEAILLVGDKMGLDRDRYKNRITRHRYMDDIFYMNDRAETDKEYIINVLDKALEDVK